MTTLTHAITKMQMILQAWLKQMRMAARLGSDVLPCILAQADKET